MKNIYKYLVSTVLVLMLTVGAGAAPVFAQFTILPQSKHPASCENYLKSNTEDQINAALKTADRDEVLACAINTGRISLNMIPYFVSYVTNFFLALIGLISVLFIVIGGYFYIWGGLTENKEKGKKTIYHALLGMALALLAWSFVNVVISAITS